MAARVASPDRSILFDADVLELAPHGFAGMELQGDDAFLQRQIRLLIGEIDDQEAVEVVFDIISLGDDDVIVPAIEFESGPVIVLVAEGGHDRLLAILPHRLFTDEADAASFSAFVVNEARNVGEHDFVTNLSLITRDAPLIDVGVLEGFLLAAILDARII